MEKLTKEQVRSHVESVSRDGFSIMENAINSEFLREIRDELARLEEVRPGGDIPPGPFTGFVTRRWFDVLNDAEVWQRVATHPWILQVMEGVLGEGFLLSTMGSAVVGDGEEAQLIHTDDQVYLFPRPHPNLVCNTMWALSDFSEMTGATRIVPGSNNWEEDPDGRTSYDSISLDMPAGSIAFVVGTCYHGAGANRSGADRVALTINYCNGSMRQQENLMLGIHPSRMLSFSPELQDILGFKICKGAGHIFAQDPRLEMNRHFGALSREDPYLTVRDTLHSERVAGAASAESDPA
ncbi:MAG: phytanoyl-CoA dioxygenase family protein [Candidatus Azotimanducaceae bacterium]